MNKLFLLKNVWREIFLSINKNPSWSKSLKYLVFYFFYFVWSITKSYKSQQMSKWIERFAMQLNMEGGYTHNSIIIISKLK